MATFNTQVNRHWENEMMAAITGLEVPFELVDTSAEANIRIVIEYALAGDRTKVNEIHDRMMLVVKHLADNFVPAKMMTRN